MVISEYSDKVVRVIDPETWSSFRVGGGSYCYSSNMAACSGPGDTTDVSKPSGVALTGDGSVAFFTTISSHGHTIFKIDLGSDAASSTVTLLAGKPNKKGDEDGVGTDARFDDPADIATNVDGTTLFIANTDENQIKRMDVASRQVVTMVNLGSSIRPSTIAVTPDGSEVYFFAALYYQSTSDLRKISSATSCTSCTATTLYPGVITGGASTPHTGTLSLTKDAQQVIITNTNK